MKPRLAAGIATEENHPGSRRIGRAAATDRTSSAASCAERWGFHHRPRARRARCRRDSERAQVAAGRSWRRRAVIAPESIRRSCWTPAVEGPSASSQGRIEMPAGELRKPHGSRQVTESGVGLRAAFGKPIVTPDERPGGARIEPPLPATLVSGFPPWPFRHRSERHLYGHAITR